MVDMKGRIHKTLTDGIMNREVPSWSPDGNRISFVGNEGNGPWQIYMMYPWEERETPGVQEARVGEVQ